MGGMNYHNLTIVISSGFALGKYVIVQVIRWQKPVVLLNNYRKKDIEKFVKI